MLVQTADLRPWRPAGSPFAAAGAGKPADDHVHQAVAREKIPVPVPAKMRDVSPCSRGWRSGNRCYLLSNPARRSPRPCQDPPGPAESSTISSSVIPAGTGRLRRPACLAEPVRPDTRLTGEQALALFDAQIGNRHLDLADRYLRGGQPGFIHHRGARPARRWPASCARPNRAEECES